MHCFAAGFPALRFFLVTQRASNVDRFLELPYHIVLVRDEAEGESRPWIARVEELPGCEARDETSEGAARAVSQAMEQWLADAVEKGAPVPEPRRTSSHSGRLLLRIPQGLHAELAHRADREEVSLNGLITGMLAGAVGWQREDEIEEAASKPLPSAAPSRSRLLPVAIVANIVVVVIAALAAIVLLIVAWQNGW
jgi:antitoxin HicB